MTAINQNQWTFEDLDLEGAHSELSAEYERLNIIKTFLTEKSEKLNTNDDDKYKIWKFIYEEEKIIWEAMSKIHSVLLSLEYLMSRSA